MDVVYSTRRHPFAEGRKFQNPRRFAGVLEGAKKVYIEGDFPAVAKAYERVGVPVIKLNTTGVAVTEAPEKATKAAIAAELSSLGVEADPRATKAELQAQLDEATKG